MFQQAKFACAPRRGVILLVVVTMLTVFAIVGISFVLYAEAEAVAARYYKESDQVRADMDPEALLAFFLGQLIYDLPDNEGGIYSALRGYSLARSMYGWNYNNGGPPILNNQPFNGTGRLHYIITGLGDNYDLINYTWFRDAGMPLRDPERFGVRANPSITPGPYRGGANAPYTYPDLNSLFLSATRSDGTIRVSTLEAGKRLVRGISRSMPVRIRRAFRHTCKRRVVHPH